MALADSRACIFQWTTVCNERLVLTCTSYDDVQYVWARDLARNWIWDRIRAHVRVRSFFLNYPQLIITAKGAHKTVTGPQNVSTFRFCADSTSHKVVNWARAIYSHTNHTKQIDTRYTFQTEETKELYKLERNVTSVCVQCASLHVERSIRCPKIILILLL